MILQPHPERVSHWGTAFALSTVVHLLGFVYAFDLLPFDPTVPTPPVAFPDISISNIVIEEEQPQNLVPETLSQVSPYEEVAENLEPESAEAVTSEEENLRPEAETLPATTPAAETLVPQPEPEDFAALEPTPVSPLAPDAGQVLQGSTTLEPQRVAPARASTTVVAPVSVLPTRQPAPPPVSPAPPPTPSQIELLELIERIRNRLGDPCLVALPQSQGTQGNPLVVLVSDQDRTMATFTREVLSDPELQVDQRAVIVDNRQCPALDFARARPNYPSFKVPLKLQATLVNSGSELRGAIENVAGYYTSLLLVDDNGVVQDLRRFIRFESGRAAFEVPVTRDGAARDTSQLLVAIATQGRPATVTNLAGRLAADFFPALEAEIGAGAVMAVVPFDLR